MAARRLLILMLVLLGTSTLAAALVPQPSEREPTTSTTTPPRTSHLPSNGELIRVTVDAQVVRPERIAVPLGDQLALVVRSAKAGQVAIPELGLLEDVLPLGPARFNVLPTREGRFEVHLLDPRRVIAVIEVTERRER